MADLRTFRNTDPPRLVEIWNETLTGRGAVTLPTSTPLERYVLSKPIFDPAGLFLAEVDGVPVGFAHAGLAQPLAGAAVGVACALLVRPGFQRRGIGTQLLTACEDYLRQRGAESLLAGGASPFNPFYLGLYGGSASPGFLRSDAAAEPFFLHNNYQVQRRLLVFQRRLKQPLRVADSRFAQARHRFVLHGCAPRHLDGYWQECTLGFVDPLELTIEDRENGQTAARCLVWEMEGFSSRWQNPAVGLVGFEVEPAYRRQGLGKYLLTHLLRQLEEQYFEIIELQLAEDNQAGLNFVQTMGFQQVDVGQVFSKKQ